MVIPLQRSFTLLRTDLRPLWPRVLLLALVLAGTIGLQLYNPRILARFVDAAGAGRATPELTALAALFLGLALARVFLRDPGLVILDQASTRLDPATEERIERALDRLLRDRTAVISPTGCAPCPAGAGLWWLVVLPLVAQAGRLAITWVTVSVNVTGSR